jgi:hypothetical protein
MMFECIEKSIAPRVAAKLLRQADEIARDGPMMFMQIIANTFVTTTTTTFATKTALFNLNLEDTKYNVITFHEDVREKVTSLEAVGHHTADIDLIVSLFKAYEGSKNPMFLVDVRMMKNSYAQGQLTTSDALMNFVEARYDELVKTDQWEPPKPKEDPNLVALTATVQSLQDDLAKAKAKGASNSGGGSRSRGRSGNEWKFDASLGTNGIHSHSSEGRTPKTYKWCAGPGHGGKAMWVCGHEPGRCTENYERPNQGGNNQRSNQGGHSNSGSSGHTTNAGDTDSIQALRAVLENANFGDDASAQLQACLALLQR